MIQFYFPFYLSDNDQCTFNQCVFCFIHTGGSFVSQTVARGESSPFISPFIDLKYRPKCIRFWYQLYHGRTVQMKVYSVTENKRTIMKEDNITHIGSTWTETTVYTETENMFQVRLTMPLTLIL